MVLPRILMHEMPDGWQGRMAVLLEEYQNAFPRQPNIGTRVQCTDRGGRLISWPGWLLNYRRPDAVEIHKLRAEVRS